MRRLICGIFIVFLSGCVGISEQSSMIAADDRVRINIVHDENTKDIAFYLKKQFDSSIQIVQQNCSEGCLIEQHPDLVIALGKCGNLVSYQGPVISAFEKDIDLEDKIAFLKQATKYKKIVAIDLKVEGLDTIKSDENLEKKLKNVDAILVKDDFDREVDVPIVLSHHPKNKVDVVVEKFATIESVMKVSQQVLQNQPYREEILPILSIEEKK